MSLAQVNISGLRAATDESRNRHRRLIWVFLLTACFAVMVAQITDRVRHFLSEPVSVQVRVERNSSLTYPAITLCNKVSYVTSYIRLRGQMVFVTIVLNKMLTKSYLKVFTLWHSSNLMGNHICE